MAMSRETREELTRRQAALSGITKNPLWQDQIAEWQREVARIEKRMLREAMKREGANQRVLDFLRGFREALEWQIQMPNNAERNLIAYLKKQGIEITQEEEIDV
jgi:hypothetical protein